MVQEVLAIEPESEEAHARLDGLYTQSERWDELAHTLETGFDWQGTGRRIGAGTIGGGSGICVGRRVWSRRSSSLSGEGEGHEGTIEALERLFEAQQESDRIAPLLTLYEETESGKN